MAELLVRADHEKLMAGPSAAGRRCPGDTSAILENEYQGKILSGQTSAQATTARSALAAVLIPRPDGR